MPATISSASRTRAIPSAVGTTSFARRSVGSGVRSTTPSSSSSSTSRPTTCLWSPARRASSVALTPPSSRNARTGPWRGRRSRCPRSLRPSKSSCWVDASSLAARTARSGAQRCRSPRPLMVVTIKTVTKKNCIDTVIGVQGRLSRLYILPGKTFRPKGDMRMTTTRHSNFGAALRTGALHGDAGGRPGSDRLSRSAAYRRPRCSWSGALLFNLLQFFFSDKIALKASGAKPVTEEEAPRLYQMVRELTTRAGLPMPTLHLIPQAQPNAFATGRSPKKSAVAVTQGLLSTLSRGRGARRAGPRARAHPQSRHADHHDRGVDRHGHHLHRLHVACGSAATTTRPSGSSAASA